MYRFEVLTRDRAPSCLDMTFPLVRPLLERFDRALCARVVTHEDRPVGLAVATLAPGSQEAELLSLHVSPEHRARGLGSRLLDELESALNERGARGAIASFTPRHCDVPALGRVLARNGWTNPRLHMLVVQSTLDAIAAAPWLDLPPLGPDYEIFPWHRLPPEDAADILARQAAEPWIPPDLVPFDQDEACDPDTSLGLRYRGKVVGWVVNHRWGDDTLHFTCSYVRRDLQKMSPVVVLYGEVVRRMRRLGISKGLWTVPVEHRGMAAFARRRMAPYATVFEESYRTERRFEA